MPVSSVIGNDKTPSFDLIIFQRESGIRLKAS